MLRFTLDSASEFVSSELSRWPSNLFICVRQLLGTRIDSLSAGLLYPASSPQSKDRLPHKSDVFSEAFASALRTIGGRGWNGPSWPLLEMFEDATRKDVKDIQSFLDPILQSAATQYANNPSKSDHSTFLDHLVSETDDPDLLRDELLNILVAGERPSRLYGLKYPDSKFLYSS